MKFIVVGDRTRYEIDSGNLTDAWDCAEKEIPYQVTKNTKVLKVYPKYSTERR